MQRPRLSGLVTFASVVAILIGGAMAQGTASHVCGPQPLAVTQAARGEEQSFRASSIAAMDRMMLGMPSQPAGNVEREFIEMMVPHHRGAIEMSVAFLRYGKNEQLRRLAQEIIVTQQQEIEAMQRAISVSSFSDAPVPGQGAVGRSGPVANFPHVTRGSAAPG